MVPRIPPRHDPSMWAAGFIFLALVAVLLALYFFAGAPPPDPALLVD